MPTGIQVQYYHLCHRKLWLFSHGICMEQTSALVAEGRLIDEYSYPQRSDRWQALQIEQIKIDHYDAVRRIVREVKKSNRKEAVHIAQLKYYLFVLERNGIPVDHGCLEYPKMRQTEQVWLSSEDRVEIPLWEQSIQTIVAQADCPKQIHAKWCKQCAYYDFCYIGVDQQ